MVAGPLAGGLAVAGGWGVVVPAGGRARCGFMARRPKRGQSAPKGG